MTPMYALALIATVSNVYPHVLRDFLHRYISSQVLFEVSFVSLLLQTGGRFPHVGVAHEDKISLLVLRLSSTSPITS
jgi:hypothetical protein